MGHLSYFFTVTGNGRFRALVNWKKFKDEFPIEFAYFVRQNNDTDNTLSDRWSLIRLFSSLLKHYKSLGYWPEGEKRGDYNDSYHFHREWHILFTNAIEWCDDDQLDILQDEEKMISENEFTNIIPRVALPEERGLGKDGMRVYFEIEDQPIRWYLEFQPLNKDVTMGCTCDWETCAVISKRDRKLKKMRQVALNKFKWLRVPFTYPLDPRVACGSVCSGELSKLVAKEEFECKIATREEVKEEKSESLSLSLSVANRTRSGVKRAPWIHCDNTLPVEHKFCFTCGARQPTK
jgi:hypothetical protein